jgi:Zn-dependent protease
LIGSWKIARLFGIDIRLHWTFFVLILIVVQRMAEPLVGLFVILTAFVSVLLHELGHSLVARRFGIKVLDISFWPLGGMARMSEIPEEPRVEGWVAIAGPAVNFALVALAAPALVFALATDAPPLLQSALQAFVAINVMLGVFNLVPAFPMDGGRILRALLARKMNYVRATEIAVRAGRAVAAGMVALALLTFFTQQPMYLLPLIAAFVWFAGGRELLVVRLRHGQSPFGPLNPLAGAFARANADGAREPEFDARSKPGDAIASEPADGPRRPKDWEPEIVPRPQSGFSEEMLRRLERYPGRLPRPRDSDPLE